MGRDVCIALVKQGATVYALSKNAENLKSLAEQYPNFIKPISCDLRNWEETEKVISEIEPLDHLVNNAGVAFRENFFDMKSDTFDE